MNALQRASQTFRRAFDAPAECFAQAPGRVNLIGGHTDYNDGFVLPTAIDKGTVVAARRRPDPTVRVIAADFLGQKSTFEVGPEIAKDPGAAWASYVRGVVQALVDMGHALRGADLVIAGDLPRGVGLSSSASLEMAVGTAIAHINGLTISPTTLARVGQRAENDYVGCQCGIMDQLISAAGEAGHALLIDCRSLETRSLAIPPEMAVFIIDSGIRRELVASAYNTRCLQCESAATRLGVPALRDVSLNALDAAAGDWDADTYRRARHVVSENQRTLEAADALERGDVTRVGELMAASHRSLRDDFEVTIPAIDFLVERLAEIVGPQGGVRMTGGGFGGCVVALAPIHMAPALRAVVDGAYAEHTGHVGRFFICRPSAGAGLVTPASPKAETLSAY